MGWLSLLNATLPPIGAVLIIDYFVNRKGYVEDENLPAIRWASIIALVAGSLVGWFTKSYGIASINAVVAAIVVYLIGRAASRALTK